MHFGMYAPSSAKILILIELLNYIVCTNKTTHFLVIKIVTITFKYKCMSLTSYTKYIKYNSYIELEKIVLKKYL